MVAVLENGLCEYCDPAIASRARLAKQREVKMWLDLCPELGDYIVYDRTIDGGECGRKRPDFMCDDGTHRTILEVVTDRNAECEHSRMVNVSQSNGSTRRYYY